MLVRTPAFFPFRGEGGGGRGTEPVRYRGVVFGTLLGPEATGPRVLPPFVGWGLRVCLFLVSWLHRSCTYVCGVCGLGLLFENYIVDASIFYKKQFPRI